MKAWEVNFDGLPGLTHHYAGLSFGNEASTKHRYRVSNPQLAAKQGLKKMKALADAGYPQALIPPQERPNIPLLRQIGFDGSDEQVLKRRRARRRNCCRRSAPRHRCGSPMPPRSRPQPTRWMAGCI